MQKQFERYLLSNLGVKSTLKSENSAKRSVEKQYDRPLNVVCRGLQNLSTCMIQSGTNEKAQQTVQQVRY